jgi:hypothetical protein
MRWLESRRGRLTIVAVFALLPAASVAVTGFRAQAPVASAVPTGRPQASPAREETGEVSFSEFVRASEHGEVTVQPPDS